MIDLLYAYLTYYILATVGITFGFHRYFALRDFKVHSTIEVVMLYCGVLCGGQSALSWSGVHRMHHAYADTKKDPHSPKYNKWWQILFSTWRVDNIPRKFVKDLFKNPRVMKSFDNICHDCTLCFGTARCKYLYDDDSDDKFSAYKPIKRLNVPIFEFQNNNNNNNVVNITLRNGWKVLTSIEYNFPEFFLQHAFAFA